MVHRPSSPRVRLGRREPRPPFHGDFPRDLGFPRWRVRRVERPHDVLVRDSFLLKLALDRAPGQRVMEKTIVDPELRVDAVVNQFFVNRPADGGLSLLGREPRTPQPTGRLPLGERSTSQELRERRPRVTPLRRRPLLWLSGWLRAPPSRESRPRAARRAPCLLRAPARCCRSPGPVARSRTSTTSRFA